MPLDPSQNEVTSPVDNIPGYQNDSRRHVPKSEFIDGGSSISNPPLNDDDKGPQVETGGTIKKDTLWDKILKLFT